mmetsp:Transcript_37564/g.94932  ORF Transcript_37564/g.94932 Transcript_37564/m.94932 type:complete len:293 (+) Transcript_37564:79-957(+)
MSSSQVIVAPARLWSVCSHRLLVADLVVGRHVVVLLLVRVCHLLPLAADQLAQLPKGGLRVLRLHALPHRVGEHHERGHGLLRRVLVLDLLGLLGGRLLAALGRLVGLGLALLGLGRRAAALAVRAPRHVVAGHVAAVVRVVLGRLAVVVLLAAHLEILVLFAPLVQHVRVEGHTRGAARALLRLGQVVDAQVLGLRPLEQIRPLDLLDVAELVLLVVLGADHKVERFGHRQGVLPLALKLHDVDLLVRDQQRRLDDVEEGALQWVQVPQVGLVGALDGQAERVGGAEVAGP